MIEVLESKNEVVRSKSIGRLLPIYNLTEGLTAERLRSFIQLVLPLSFTFEVPMPTENLQALCLLNKCDEVGNTLNQDKNKIFKNKVKEFL